MLDKNVFKAIAKRRGLSRELIAKEMRVSPGTITHWARGMHKPTLSDIYHLAQLLDIDPLLLHGVPVPYNITDLKCRQEYRAGYLEALASERMTQGRYPNREHGYRDGLMAVLFGYQESEL